MPMPVSGSASPAPVARAAFGSAAVACVDLGAKGVAGAVLPEHTVLTNADLSLGVASGKTWLLVGLMAAGVLAAAAAGNWALRTGRAPWWPVALVLGGAIGNLVDRAAYGAVRDFIPVGPVVINVADVAVLIGMLAIACAWQSPRHDAERRGSPSLHVEGRR